jgi:hypothetical protein
MAGMRAPLLDVQSSDGQGNGSVFHSGLSNGHHLHHHHGNGSGSNGHDHKSLNGHSYSQIIASSSGSSSDEQRLVLSSLDDSTPSTTGEEGVLYGAEMTDDLLWGPPLEKV